MLIYGAGLPNPGAPIASLDGPLLTDGFINEFDFVLARESNVEIAVYDVSGRMVATLADEEFAPGRHSVPWSGTGMNDAPLSSGVYFAVVRAGDFRATKKVVLSR